MAKKKKIEEEVDVVKPQKKRWVVVRGFRDKDNFNKVHKVGDEVEHSTYRESLGLIEFK